MSRKYHRTKHEQAEGLWPRWAGGGQAWAITRRVLFAGDS